MQVRAPDEGPSSGGPSAPTVGDGGQSMTPQAAAAERQDPKVLRAVAKKYAIDSTKTLVEAYNAATDNERAVLLGWLLRYDRRNKECLSGESVLDYAELARITPSSIRDKGVLKNLVCSLCSCVHPGKFLEENVAAALFKALVHVDPSVSGGVAQLLVMARKLLSSLSPEPRLTRDNFAEHEATFLALLQTLLLLSEISQNGVYEKEKQELRQAVVEKERAMELSCKYYPVSFHFKTLRQAVERLGTKDTSSRHAHAMQNVGCVLCGFLYLFHCVGNLARCDIDPEALQDAYIKARVAIANIAVWRKPWFDTFKNLMIARQEASKDEIKLELFETNFSAAIELQENTKDKEDSKALRYGIVRELGTLAIDGLSENARNAATKKLVDLATQQIVDEGWTSDSHVLIALLDVMCELHGIDQHNEDVKNALLVLHQFCEGSAKKASEEWMDGNSIENKLQERNPQRAAVEHENLCIKIGRDVGYIPLAIMNSKGGELKKRYMREDFAKVIHKKAHTSRRRCLVL